MFLLIFAVYGLGLGLRDLRVEGLRSSVLLSKCRLKTSGLGLWLRGLRGATSGLKFNVQV